jgi:hypothetical protein
MSPESDMFKKKTFDEDFFVLRDINWTGTIIMAPFGEDFGADAIELCNGFTHGSLCFTLSREGEILGRMADHGDCDFPSPASDERLCLVSADPMLFGARLLDVMAEIFPQTDVGEDFSERDRAEAHHFLSRMSEAGIGQTLRDEPEPSL